METIGTADLLINENGTIYHLGLSTQDVPDNIIVVGDPGRVEMVASYFDVVSNRASNREYKSVTGFFADKPVMVISSGIGCGPVDILINELDALVNVDFSTRTVKKELRRLNIVRLGTCGAFSDTLSPGDFVQSCHTIGIDSLALYYKECKEVREPALERLFCEVTSRKEPLPQPYAVKSSSELVSRFADITRPGITVCAGGFFAPQGRKVRLSPADPTMIESLVGMSYDGIPFTNMEMEGAALTALGRALGHRVTTICLVIAHRTRQQVTVNYHERMNTLIVETLKRL